jgi:hypothetical protein
VEAIHSLRIHSTVQELDRIHRIFRIDRMAAGLIMAWLLILSILNIL